MKLLLSLLSTFVFTGVAMAGEVEKSLPDYVINSVEKDASLEPGETAFSFRFFVRRNIDMPIKGEEISLSYNGKTTGIKTDAKTGNADLKLNKGGYKFQFYYSELYSEIYTDTIKVEGGKRTSVSVYFTSSKYPVVAEKPVIYLYPEKTTEVNVQLAVKGTLTFTYPAYKNMRPDKQAEPGWSVTADPDGTLHQGDKTFNYLFWEADMPLVAERFQICRASVVAKKDLLTFLEKNLASAGLNGKESQDFITYWYPRMQQYEFTSVDFMLNENFDTYAHLDITPKPDRVLRLFMTWSDAGNVDCAGLYTKESFPVFERKGFTVVEWGGMQVNNLSK